MKGKIQNFTGFDSPYEVPEKPEIVVQTRDGEAEEAARGLLDVLRGACYHLIRSQRPLAFSAPAVAAACRSASAHPRNSSGEGSPTVAVRKRSVLA